MVTSIKYFGWIGETLQKSEEMLEHSFTQLDELDRFIRSQSPQLLQAEYRISYNLSLEHDNPLLKEGDEIAFLPPFSGG